MSVAAMLGLGEGAAPLHQPDDMMAGIDMLGDSAGSISLHQLEDFASLRYAK
jgi:hypothetical protein